VIHVRRATPDDAAGIAHVMETVTSERIHSAIDRAWSVEEERAYLASRSDRQAVFVAAEADGAIVGCQVLDFYSHVLPSMSHVGEIGTFLLPKWRRRGVGQALFEQTRAFAKAAGYRKFVITVRGSNDAAQAFYTRLGFVACGRLSDQVILDGRADDEILLEYFVE
jgi:ribosomal protein S18 acetylase RimI-like enzyme